MKIENDGITIHIDSDFMVELFDTMGHEIGHTFHFDLTKNPIENTIPNEREMSDGLYNLVENFAEAFSKKWFVANGSEKLEKWYRYKRAEKARKDRLQGQE